MSIKKLALTAIAAAALVAPSLSAANAHHINKKKHHVAEKYDFDKYDDYDDYVRNKRKTSKIRHSGTVRTPGITRRMERQIERIRTGRRNGDLTWREARRLKKGIRNVRRALRSARRDGDVTRYERREIRDILDQNGQRIRRLRNNDRRANRHLRKFRKYVDLSF